MNETTAARGDRTYGIAISSAVLLLMLLGFEGFLRLTYEEHRPGEGSCGIFSDTLLWSTKPFCGGTNSRGYRDHEHQLEKPEGVFRIVILGDSVVHGYRIEDLNDTFAKVLERRLNQSAEGRSTETILLARGGYTTQQQLTLLRDEALAYGPDLILLNYVLNDPLNPIYHPIHFNVPRYGYQNKWHKPTSHAVAFVRQKLFFLRERWKGRACPDEYHHFIHCAYRAEVAVNLQAIGEFSKRNGIPILLVINPVFHRGAFEEYALAGLHEDLANMARRKGLAVHDLLDAFEPYDVEEVGFCQGDVCDVWHPSRNGHRIMADSLYGVIEPLR